MPNSRYLKTVACSHQKLLTHKPSDWQLTRMPRHIQNIQIIIHENQPNRSHHYTSKRHLYIMSLPSHSLASSEELVLC